eukprot:3099250-Alexandrium_andersonii.AAC.1
MLSQFSFARLHADASRPHTHAHIPNTELRPPELRELRPRELRESGILRARGACMHVCACIDARAGR